MYLEDMSAGRTEGYSDAGEGVCVEFVLPYICSKPSTPSTAHGGLMYGCKNGGWMMGTAHSDPNLPPTIVRLLLQSCC